MGEKLSQDLKVTLSDYQKAQEKLDLKETLKERNKQSMEKLEDQQQKNLELTTRLLESEKNQIESRKLNEEMRRNLRELEQSKAEELHSMDLNKREELGMLKKSCEEELERVSKQFDERAAELEQQKAEEIRRVEENANSRQQQFLQEQQAEKDLFLQQQQAKLDSELAKQKSDHEVEVNTLKKALTSDKDSVVVDYEAKLQLLDLKVTEYEKLLEREREEAGQLMREKVAEMCEEKLQLDREIELHQKLQQETEVELADLKKTSAAELQAAEEARQTSEADLSAKALADLKLQEDELIGAQQQLSAQFEQERNDLNAQFEQHKNLLNEQFSAMVNEKDNMLDEKLREVEIAWCAKEGSYKKEAEDMLNSVRAEADGYRQKMEHQVAVLESELEAARQLSCEQTNIASRKEEEHTAKMTEAAMNLEATKKDLEERMKKREDELRGQSQETIENLKSRQRQELDSMNAQKRDEMESLRRQNTTEGEALRKLLEADLLQERRLFEERGRKLDAELRDEIEEHLSRRENPDCLTGKSAGAAVAAYREKTEFLKFEIMRYETYVIVLRTQNGGA